MFTEKYMTMKDPKSFNTLTFLEIGSRHLFQEAPQGGLDVYEPEVYTHVEFKRELEALGKTRYEVYTSPESLLEVTRGSVTFDGIERFFYLEHASNGLYKSMVDGVISAITYTKEV